MDVLTLALSNQLTTRNLTNNGQIGYDEFAETEAIPMQTIEVAMNEELGLPIAFISPGYNFDGLYEAKVLWDGVEYVCTPTSSGGALGNIGIIGEGEDTGEPFAIAYDAESGMSFVISSEGTHTVRVVAVSKITHKMDKRFLPMIDGVLKIVDVHIGSENEKTVQDIVATITLDEIQMNPFFASSLLGSIFSLWLMTPVWADINSIRYAGYNYVLRNYMHIERDTDTGEWVAWWSNA